MLSLGNFHQRFSFGSEVLSTLGKCLGLVPCLLKLMQDDNRKNKQIYNIITDLRTFNSHTPAMNSKPPLQTNFPLHILKHSGVSGLVCVTEASKNTLTPLQRGTFKLSQGHSRLTRGGCITPANRAFAGPSPAS